MRRRERGSSGFVDAPNPSVTGWGSPGQADVARARAACLGVLYAARMRPYLLLALSGCSLVAGYDEQTTRHDGRYVLEGSVQSDTCETPGASTVRLNLVVKGETISGPFSCEGPALVGEDTFDKVWYCPTFRALLTGAFEENAMSGVYTLAYPTCERSYQVRGARQ